MSIASLSGTFTNTPIASVRWGAGSVKSLPEVIRDVLKPSIVTKQDENAQAVQPKAMIITGKSLMSKTPVIKDIEEMLKKEGMYGVTFSEIAQHARECDSCCPFRSGLTGHTQRSRTLNVLRNSLKRMASKSSFLLAEALRLIPQR